VAVFGEKDAQQLALVRRMAGDLDLGVEIAGVPTVRDPDGLAVSSRNSYLSAAERRTALALPRALRAGREAQEAGPEAVLKAAGAVLDEAATAVPPLVTDYLSLADPGTFTPVTAATPVTAGYAGEALLLAAARVGSTRLIDNVQLVLGAREGHAADD
jgi:pantoate--beta-alanine ligase